MTPGTVVVIDDDAGVLKAVSRLIRSVGLSVVTFNSPESFLAKGVPDRPSCLVLDVRMPHLSGLELQAELRQANRQVPIIFITGHGDVPMSVRAMKAGAVDFLQKPFNDQELIDAIHRAIDQDRETQQKLAEREDIRLRMATLTARETEVLALVVDGLPNKQIADRLGISEKTIKVHRGRVMRKMEAESLPDLVRMAQKAQP